MSKYTTELWKIMRTMRGKPIVFQYTEIENDIDQTWDKIFTRFPIWDENYRPVLCQKILAHYYSQEIGCDSPALFVFRLNRTMHEIMPYYNELYKTQIKEIEDLYGINLFEDYIGKTEKDINENTHTDKVQNITEERDLDRNENIGAAYNTTRTPNLTTESSYTDNTDQTESRNLSSNETKTDEGESANTTIHGKTNLETINRTDKTVYDTNVKKTGSDTTAYTSDKTERLSDTPQGGLSYVDVENNMYLSQVTINHQKDNTKVTYDNNTANTGSDTTTKTGTLDNKEGGSTREEKNYSALITGSTKDTGTIATDSEQTGSATRKDTGSENTDTTNTTDKTIISVDTYLKDLLEQITKVSTTQSDEDKSYTKHLHGANTSDWADELMKWRESLLNIDMLIIEELQSLFILLW